MAKTRFFRVAVEGATTDGRTIERQWLADAAATYNRETYAARVNMEHIRGITADKPFKSYGDVLSLKTEDVEIELGGKKEKKLALFAELDVTDELLAINKDRQKLYTSIEISPNFANSGKAYLVGLAVTDSPASLGTEMLQFAASQGDKNPLLARKQDPANLFTAAIEADLQIEEAPEINADPTGVLASAKAFFDRFISGGQQEQKEPVVVVEPPVTPELDGTAMAAFGAIITQMATTVTELATSTKASIDKLTSDVKSVADKLEATPAIVPGSNPQGFTQRPLATGGNVNAARTDC
ncbi:GPO family capsid scaffolding protein [Novosphingobium sp. ES2-1]|uniref:GPO family capsid scaffolding protein n=1 Tax=Novosphingobium sp. ES2-1 TaxID=2780074 RepID=UPI0018800183|nr:GPO family capsid scaffolding protein [Novosphingobium sp. ES2-1]QOV92607.1 GPO family capsid scaffolding protein [Novosphingobium sp. ES2-1]